MNPRPPYELADLRAILPHGEPFLFVDRVTGLAPGQWIVAERTLRAEEPHFAGHFPGRPIMPGVLIGEALAQASGLLIGLTARLSPTAPTVPMAFFLANVNLKFTRPAKPGETLELKAVAERQFGGLHYFTVEATIGGQPIARGALTLAAAEGY